MTGVKVSKSSMKRVFNVTRKNEYNPKGTARHVNRRVWIQGTSSSTSSFPFETTMTSSDTGYTVNVNAGQVVLPDSQELLDSYSFEMSSGETYYIYLVISATQSDTGGWSDWVAVISEYEEQQENTDDENYFLLSYIIDDAVNQERSTSFDSGGRVQ